MRIKEKSILSGLVLLAIIMVVVVIGKGFIKDKMDKK